ncbi:MAG: hypothetical protein EZS28_034355 [Streblomastix strix]|uniref:Uncharacterized protein n=1 Tax=Streblomastix strix TaxID=222440 RepID=A0A5J4UH35_9EUKA|nr:MAG: hypothetical protein EZS28_034355 [Streblomastix strix]
MSLSRQFLNILIDDVSIIEKLEFRVVLSKIQTEYALELFSLFTIQDAPNVQHDLDYEYEFVSNPQVLTQNCPPELLKNPQEMKNLRNNNRQH